MLATLLQAIFGGAGAAKGRSQKIGPASVWPDGMHFDDGDMEQSCFLTQLPSMARDQEQEEDLLRHRMMDTQRSSRMYSRWTSRVRKIKRSYACSQVS